jgi:purine-binding chemotaxis protein CheW
MGAASVFPFRRRYVIFHLADRNYALPLDCVEEIAPMAELSTVPGSPSLLSGFLNIGGRLIPVVSLRRLWRMPDREPELYTPLLALQGTQRQIALEIDGVTRVVEIDPASLTPIDDGSSANNCATHIINMDERPVVLLAPERILMEEERQRLAELGELAQQRIAQLESPATC